MMDLLFSESQHFFHSVGIHSIVALRDTVPQYIIQSLLNLPIRLVIAEWGDIFQPRVPEKAPEQRWMPLGKESGPLHTANQPTTGASVFT